MYAWKLQFLTACSDAEKYSEESHSSSDKIFTRRKVILKLMKLL